MHVAFTVRGVPFLCEPGNELHKKQNQGKVKKYSIVYCSHACKA